MRPLLLSVILCVASAPAAAPPIVKRPLRHSDYASWRSIQAPALSPDGRYVAYALAPQEGDGEVVVRHVDSGKEVRVPRGTPPPPAAAPPSLSTPPTRTIVSPQPTLHRFTPDGRFVLFPLYAPRAERARGGAPTGMSALGVVRLADGTTTRLDRVTAFQVPDDGRAVVAYLRGAAPPPAAKSAPAAARKGDLVLRTLDDGRERVVAGVTEFTLSRDGKWLVYVVAGEATRPAGVFALRTDVAGPPFVLHTGAGTFSRLTWDEQQTQLAFFHTPPKPPTGQAVPIVCHWRRPAANLAPAVILPPPVGGIAGVAAAAVPFGLPTARELVPAGVSAFQSGHTTHEAGGLTFSHDGTRLFFGVAPPAPAADPVNVELWHYRDDFVQSMQKVRLERQPVRTARAVVHLDGRTVRQLADDALSDVFTSTSGDWTVAVNDRPYRRLAGVEGASPPVDVYLLNTRTGERRRVFEKAGFGVFASPAGRWVTAFDGTDWQAVSIPDGRRINLTARCGVSFASEQHDSPGPPPPYGIAGWTADDQHILLYDRYDVWQAPLDGAPPRNLTGGAGRKSTTVYSVVRTDARERAFDSSKPLLLRSDSERTRATGYHRLAADGRLERLVEGPRNYGPPVVSRDGGRVLLTVSTFADFPDLHVADRDFCSLRRVSDANPQKAALVWGRAELIRYRSGDGVPLQAMLIRPEDYNPNRKYPLIVYIYERLSQNLHLFVDPRPGTSINPSFYASNGYLVLLPDITYTVGHPGASAVKCVLPAVQATIDRGGVDEAAIGLQGHSWGGYQTVYLTTQTPRFRAAAAGAPVCNMTSAYGGIRWGTGLPRQFQYERTQSRLGGTLWQMPSRFVENSPLFQADRIRTPLLILHNDRDDAVPFEQGLELYLALRRLDRAAYLFNYRGELHGLRQRVNQKDYTVRLQQFFDHHLKGAPPPGWMTHGQPYRPPPAARSPTASPEP